MQSKTQFFGGSQIRAVWDSENEKWYFSIVDVIAVLTESNDFLRVRKYWNKLKQRLKEEGNETVTNCHQLKFPAADGKMRLTDVGDVEQILRLIQSIPSKKAESKNVCCTLNLFMASIFNCFASIIVDFLYCYSNCLFKMTNSVPVDPRGVTTRKFCGIRELPHQLISRSSMQMWFSDVFDFIAFFVETFPETSHITWNVSYV